MVQSQAPIKLWVLENQMRSHPHEADAVDVLILGALALGGDATAHRVRLTTPVDRNIAVLMRDPPGAVIELSSTCV